MTASYEVDNRFPGGLRSGEAYMEALKNDGRRVFIDGEEVGDVTTPQGAPSARNAPWHDIFPHAMASMTAAWSGFFPAT